MTTQIKQRQRAPRFTQVMQFRVELLDIAPLIWRRFQVPNSYSFWDLHCAITDAMPWKDYHLHMFTVCKPDKRKPDTIGIPNNEGIDDTDVLAGWDVFIKDYFTKKDDRAEYIYDFGDNWIHGVMFEGTTEAQEGVRYPICLDGAMAGPPEDCGGINGYERFKKAIGDPSHPEHQDQLSWIGGNFDPAHFDAKAVRFLDPARRYRVAFCGEAPPDDWD